MMMMNRVTVQETRWSRFHQLGDVVAVRTLACSRTGPVRDRGQRLVELRRLRMSYLTRFSLL